MELKDQLLLTLLENLKGESVDVFKENLNKYRIKETPDVIELTPLSGKKNKVSDLMVQISIKKDREDEYYAKSTLGCWADISVLIIILLIGLLIGILLLGGASFLFYLGGIFISNEFNLKLYISIIIEFGIILAIFVFYFFVKYLIKYTYHSFERKLESIIPEKAETKKEFDDDIYFIISNTYETLSVFRQERERQAKNTFNAALGLIIAGILIVFIGVYLLFKKNVTEGAVTSSVGAISNILGGTIIKFYRDTNNRMDRLNNDLFVLNTAKVQYAMILKIGDSKKRDSELSELIKSIGKIKSTGYNTQ
ncbi:MAG: hypothetical protein HOO91_00610 [Bacteroidales bacterium]|nr:hypothetical protein [Bacteroidales bacterium]